MEKDVHSYSREELIQEVFDMKIKKKKSFNTCLEYIKSKGYKQTASYAIMNEVAKRILELYKENNKNVLEKVVIEMEQDLEDANNREDYKLALDIRKEINKLLGLYTENINHSGNIDTKVTIIKLNGPNGDSDKSH